MYLLSITLGSRVFILDIRYSLSNKNIKGVLLSEAIKISFSNGANRLWVHTCSLDHKNALNNYLSRGMKIFKTETLVR